MAIPAAIASVTAVASSSAENSRRPVLLGEVEVAVDLAPHPHGHTEERGHRGMPAREPVAVRTVRNVGQAQTASPR